MYRPPPEYPSASSSPTIIMLVAGLTGVVGFLIGFLVGLGSLDPSAAPAPRVTVTVEEPPPDTPPTDPAVPDPAASDPAVPDPAASDPAASDPAASDPAVPDPATSAPVTPDDPVPSNPDDLLATMRTLVVGVDIQPGTYRTTGPAPGSANCYWARMSGPGLADVIDAGMPTGPDTVTIQATDKSFQTAGCAEWTRT